MDFEPVPWLAREVDLEGSIYLRADGYQLVGLVTKLNRIPPQNRALQEYVVRARFSEIVSGVPVLSEWTLTNSTSPSLPRRLLRLQQLVQPSLRLAVVGPLHQRRAIARHRLVPLTPLPVDVA